MEAKDVRDEPAFLFNLLNNASAWRERIVEEVVFGSAVHARVTSSFQINLGRDLTDPFVWRTTPGVRAYVPLTTREKRNLLQLDLTGAGGADAHLLPRGFIAALERAYLLDLAADAHLGLNVMNADLLEAICAFTPSSFRDYFVRDVGRGDYDRAMCLYLNDGLQFDDETVTSGDVAKWCRSMYRIRDPLLARLDEPLDMTSSAEVVLLALPSMAGPPETVQGVDALVQGYEDEVLRAAAAGADDFLRTLAEYGRRFEVIVETELPIDQRVTLRIAEDRPLNLAGRFSEQRFALKDAAGGHFEARATDPAVRLGDFYATDLHGRRIGLPTFEAARATDETVSIYSSNEDRPYYVRVSVQLRPTRQISLSTLLLAAILIAASTAVWLVPADQDLIDALALLVVPTTLASAFLLTREQTPLAALLQRGTRGTVALLIAVLWAASLIRLL